MDVFHNRISLSREREEPNGMAEEVQRLIDWIGEDFLSQRGALSFKKLKQGDLRMGFPRLAMEMKLATAQVCDVAVRMLLAEPLRNCYGYVDMKQIVRTRETMTPTSSTSTIHASVPRY